ncbi:VanW family protein [Alkalihalobacillus sp. AL-G]|uniref:VanW family protein n=1 Tax=Alkalihalobacillus sp. AL-G TaxID=2926399 RepID=UPI00272AE408|nr:VanW family protein [Alkalihalobacillus sp. AL-G]WLD92526.1 VanW family protein [Alkalihalobacillus sp. AL-G]
MITEKQKMRSDLRLALGRTFYRSKRYLEWLKNYQMFARTIESEPLDYKIAGHHSPIFRKLKDVDMWYQHNKATNLKLAIENLNGLVVNSGETFSYWRQIGKPTKRKGYLPGMILTFGSFKPGVGGGLCQLSNLIYWMTLHTPLIVTERHRHSYDVFPDSNRKQPFGSGATCAYNYLDLRIYNPTDQPYQLILKLNEKDLVGEWRSAAPRLYNYEIYEQDHRVSPAIWGGYIRSNKIYRKTSNQQGQCVDDELITENHARMMYEPLLQSSNDS